MALHEDEIAAVDRAHALARGLARAIHTDDMAALVVQAATVTRGALAVVTSARAAQAEAEVVVVAAALLAGASAEPQNEPQHELAPTCHH